MASGAVDGDAVRFLRSAERGRRLLLLGHVLTACAADPALLGPLGGIGPARAVLTAVEERRPHLLEGLLVDPHTGMWLVHAVRLISSGALGGEPVWPRVGVVTTLAAATGLRAGVAFELRVPVEEGGVVLPGLGRLDFSPGGHEPQVATLRARDGRLAAVLGDERIEVALPLHAEQPRWRPVRTIEAVGPGGGSLRLRLDDLDPAPQCVGLPAPTELPPAEFIRWHDRVRAAWTLLERDHPTEASALAAGLMTITPLNGAEGPASGSSGEGFGAASLAMPETDADFACAMLHEFMHSVLNGLLHMVDLVRPGPQPAVHYAPWRDDPRPLSGMLHGAYAFTSVTSFWSIRRALDSGAAGRRADLEFATWRLQTTSVVDWLSHSTGLTPLGERMVSSLRERGRAWSAHDVGHAVARLARIAAASHRAAWRVHHVRPDSSWVDRAADAWLSRSPAPPIGNGADQIVADRAAQGLNRIFTRARSHYAAESGTFPAPEGDATAAFDLLLLRGQSRAARDGYLLQLAEDPYDLGPWSGLGPAVTDLPTASRSPGVRLLAGVPEHVRAVQLALLTRTGVPPDLLRLASWLAGEA